MIWEFEWLYAIQKIHSPRLDRIMVFVTGLANHGELWIALGLILLCFVRTRRMGAGVLLSIALGYVTGNLLLKNIFARSRPCWLRPEVPLLVPVPGDYSFPSGHTLVSFEGALCIQREPEVGDRSHGFSGAHCLLQALSFCALSHRYSGRARAGNGECLGGGTDNKERA